MIILIWCISDKRQERRTAAIQCLQKLAFANLIVSTATIGVGIGAAVITSRYGVKWPVFNLAPLILGIIVSVCYMIYNRLSLSRIPRDSLKYFEISVPRHIRFAELRKK